MIKKQLVFRVALLAAVLLINYLVFSKPSYPQNIPNIDKVGHVGSFFLLAWLAYLAYRPRWYWIVLELACYGFIIEAVQYFLPYRSCDVKDFMADMAGVALFYLLLGSWRGLRKRRQSSNKA
ncbi:VanZ family protein [Shewanella sp. A32]|uniref:VanZ family protein n=1 Tax=Shewanella sp. A32 TaxID=3031327 RepID=UPI0023B8AD9F|nr:VanZ family protein [Shewanella sp. A32]MDF0533826.1 VanZ family protein [Shewanella sp. A32]